MVFFFSKFFHLICGTSFLGITIASFFYTARSIHKNDRALIDYSLRASYFGDGIIFICAVIQFVTANQLVTAGHFTLDVSWIFVAYHAFTILILFWIANFLIKYFYFSRMKIPSVALNSFYLINLTMILIFILIIHDAVTQSTWFDFLFRK